MTALEIAEQGKLVSGDTSPWAIAHRVVELLNLAAPDALGVLRAIDEFTLLLCRNQGSEVAAIEGAERPGRRCWICPEDLPGDVGGDACGGIVQITNGQGRGRDGPALPGVLEVDRHPPASRDYFLAIGEELASVPWPLTILPTGVCSRRIGGLDPDPHPVPAGARPQHPHNADDGAGEPAALHTAVLGDGCQPIRRRTARQDRWRSHLHRGQPESEFGDEIVMVALPVWPADIRFCVPGWSPPRADVSTVGGCQRIAQTSSSRYANARKTMMTSHPTRPGSRSLGPGSSGWKKALLR